MKDVLTENDIKNAISKLKSTTDEFKNLFWVDVENFYKSEVAKRMGFLCTQEELDLAKLQDKGFIKSVIGVDLYLSKHLISKSLTRSN